MRAGAAGSRYDGVAITMHWLLALVMFALIGLGWYMVDIPRGTPERAYFYNLHKSIGLTVFAVVLLRLWWRQRHDPPVLPATLPDWQLVASTWSHRLLYVCMFVLPISGYIGSNFTKFGVKYFGIDIPPWGPEDKELYAIFKNTHVYTSYLFVTLIALHAGAALKHLIFDKDGVFQRMWPGRG